MATFPLMTGFGVILGGSSASPALEDKENRNTSINVDCACSVDQYSEGMDKVVSLNMVGLAVHVGVGEGQGRGQ